jgi:DNA-binding MarR family transcriptional regulator
MTKTRQNDYAESAEQLAVAFRLLIRRLRAESPGETPLSWPQISVLKRLEVEGPMTGAALARAEHVKPQSMGATVAALRSLQLIERQRDPADGRQITLVISAKGRALLKETRAARRSWLVQALSRLEKSERDALPNVIAVLRHLAGS